MSTQTIFISDLHLSEDTPALNQLFFQALNNWKGQIDALYILGDFFDIWVGDDDDSPFIQSIIQALKHFTTETPIYFIHGNRDFLLGQQFAQATGIILLPEQQLIHLYGKPYLLLHGDELCTDDLAYQQFRLQSRNPLWQGAVLMKPLAERKLLAGQIRMMSETKKNAEGLSQISDVTETGVQTTLITVFNQIGEFPALIHGHTHRPNSHEHIINNTIVKRYVLQDWEGEQGGYLVIDSDSHIQTFKL